MFIFSGIGCLCKQTSAYEMLNSNLSSVVCSSDLPSLGTKTPEIRTERKAVTIARGGPSITLLLPFLYKAAPLAWTLEQIYHAFVRRASTMQIGSASCRERECQYV